MQKFISISVLSFFSLYFVLAPASVTLAQVPPPVSVTTTSLPPATMGTAISETLSASGGVAPYTWSATGLPNGVSVNPSTGVVSGIPIFDSAWSLPLNNDHSFSAQVQDSVGQIVTQTVNWTISSTFTYSHTPSGNGTLANPAIIRIHGTYGVDVCAGVASPVSYQIVAANQNISFNILGGGSPSLGETIDQNITLNPGIYNDIRILCLNSGIIERFNNNFTVSSVPSITTNALLTASVAGQSYSEALKYTLSAGSFGSVSADPYTWSVISGSLPSGLSLNPVTGIISGTPTAAGSFTFTAKVQDSLGQADSKIFTLSVLEGQSPPSILTTSLPPATMGTAISETLSASGGVAPYTWSATGLPNGVSVNPSTGVVSGTPLLLPNWTLPLSSEYSFTAQVQDAAGQTTTATVSWTLSPTFSYVRTPGGVSPLANPVTINFHGTYGVDMCTGLPNGYTNTGYQILFQDQTSTGRTLTSGSGSFGQSIDRTIDIAPGAYGDLRIICLNSGDIDHFGDSFTVSSVPSITTNSLLESGTAGQSYSASLQYSLSGGFNGAQIEAGPYTWSVISGSLPDGLSLDSSTGIISGTPVASASSTFSVQLQDGAGQVDSRVFTLSILAQQMPPSIETTSLPSAVMGTAVSETLSASGGVAPYTWSATGLPNGISINPSSGVISGTPLVSPNWTLPLNSDYPITAQVQDAVGQITTATISWTISSTFDYIRTPAGASPLVSSTTVHFHGTYGVDMCTGLPNGYTNTGYQILFQDQTNTGRTLVGGSGSFGQIINQNISIAPGVYGDVRIICLNSGDIDHFGDSFTVSSFPSIASNPLLEPGIAGQPYSASLEYSLSSGFNGVQIEAGPYTWSLANSSLPAGLSLNSLTGIISGTPVSVATSTFTLQVQDSLGQIDSKLFTLFTFSSNHAPVLSSIGNKSINQGQALTFTLAATDPDGDTLSYSATNLPLEATFNSSTRMFSWTPSYVQAGNYPNVEFTVMDDGSPMMLDFEDITITVGAVNRAPIFTPVGEQQVLEHNILTFTVSAVDPDGGPVSFAVSGMPPGASFNPSNGVFSWTPVYPQAGVYTPTFIATDTGAPVATSTLDVVITVGSNPTPVEQAQALIDVVVAANLPHNVENSYLANLNKVGIFIQQGKTQSAINQLNAFIGKVNQDYNQGKITLTQKNSFVSLAQKLINALQ